MRKPGDTEPCPRCRKTAVWRRPDVTGYPVGALMQWCPNCNVKVSWVVMGANPFLDERAI